jgi:hypothetical protein
MVQRCTHRIAWQRLRAAGARHIRQSRTQPAARSGFLAGRRLILQELLARSGAPSRGPRRSRQHLQPRQPRQPRWSDWRGRQRQPERGADHGHGRQLQPAQLPVRAALHLLASANSHRQPPTPDRVGRPLGRWTLGVRRPYRRGAPPSVSTVIRLVARSSNRSSLPFGHRTSTRTGPAWAPSPTCTRRSFCDR